MVGWHLHRWFHASIPKGWMWQAQQLKMLAHTVRCASLRSPVECTSSVPRNVQKCLIQLASDRPTDGFCFSRLSRALPTPPKGSVRGAVLELRAVQTTECLTSGEALDSIHSLVVEHFRAHPRRVREPKSLPASSSSCYENPGSRGGINGYLSAVANLYLHGKGGAPKWAAFPCGRTHLLEDPFDLPFFRKVEEKVPEELISVATDSLGKFCLRKVAHRFFSRRVEEYPIPTTVVDREEAIRCLGVLALRVCRQSHDCGPRSRVEALRQPGLKVRVVGVPDALTFVEGDWIRRSCHLLAPGHWMFSADDSASPPPGLHDACGVGESFVSLDLSKATDGLSHRIIGAIVDGFADARVIRPTDVPLARRSLGLEPRTKWSEAKRGLLSPDTWEAVRGSPMGTPLSFPCLSWASEWFTRGFGSSRHHGDDSVGRDMWDLGLTVAENRIDDAGARLNRSKTFISSFGWTMCEVLGLPRGRGEDMVVHVPPPCPAPGSVMPSIADPRLGRRYLKRAERVQRTLFPGFRLRLTLPSQFGGYGYTGRGLVAPVAVRKRLALLVSRGLNPSEAAIWFSKVPFQEAGLFPRPIVPRVGRPAAFYRLRKDLPSIKDYLDPEGGEQLLLKDLVASVEAQTESLYRMTSGYEGPRKMERAAHGKTRRTKPRTLFKGVLTQNVRPLSRSRGLASLSRLAKVLENSPVRIRDDCAAMIRGRTTAQST